MTPSRARTLRSICDARVPWCGRRPTGVSRAGARSVPRRPRCRRRCVSPLLGGGYSVLSEESGLQRPETGRRPRMVVVDPLDGSTNASLGLPWFATSLCLVVDDGPAVADGREPGHRGAVQRCARRGGGARRPTVCGSSARRSTTRSSPSAGCPTTTTAGAVPGAGRLGARHLRGGERVLRRVRRHEPRRTRRVGLPRGELVCEEAGGVVVDALGRELVVLDHEARRTPVAATGGACSTNCSRTAGAA